MDVQVYVTATAVVSAPLIAVHAAQSFCPDAAYVPAVQAAHTISVLAPALVVVVRLLLSAWLPQVLNGARHVSAVAELLSVLSTPASFTLSAAQAETRVSNALVQV